LDAILAKWSAEAGWPEGVTLAQAKIGWVSGTSLMGGNDILIPAAEAAGIHVWDPEEISSQLMSLASAESREQAEQAPLELDLTGGLGSSKISISELAAQVREEAEAEAASGNGATAAEEAPATIAALPNTRQVELPAPLAQGEVGEVTTDLDDMVVIAGVGEVSSWGSGRTRFEAEYGLQRDGAVDLTAAGVLELAWMTGLVQWANDPRPAWYDEEGNEVDEADIYNRFRDEVVARSGIRTLTDKYNLVDPAPLDLTSVLLGPALVFTVASKQEARDIAEAGPSFTKLREVDAAWDVTRPKGATARVPRKATLTRPV